MKLTVLLSTISSGIFSFVIVLLTLRVYSIKAVNKLQQVEKNTIEACVNKTVEVIRHRF